jgi:polygalacturonase
MSTVTIHAGAAESMKSGCDNDPRRPYGLHLVGCANVTVRHLTLRDPAFWLQRYHGCRNVRLQGLTVWNQANINSDGVDIDGCEDVTIGDCAFDVADDGICLKVDGGCLRDVTVGNGVVEGYLNLFNLRLSARHSRDLLGGQGCGEPGQDPRPGCDFGEGVERVHRDGVGGAG